MLSPEAFFQALIEKDITFFTGVPDSLLKDICAYITDNVAEGRHIIAANEGNAIALAAGWYLGSGSPALVYMQNSGIGNAINPLASLSDPEVYAIPMLLMIGWRGEPGTEDEPQHKKQGKITVPLIETMGIPYFVIGPEVDDIKDIVRSAHDAMMERSGPVAIIVRSGTFHSHKARKGQKTDYGATREDAIHALVDSLHETDLVVSTTGKASRELYEYRQRAGKGSENDFLTVGSMGHASSIAMGLALAKPERDVYCFDGDGAMIMHMGSMAIIPTKGPKNLFHIVLNNGSHDSVGGQPSVGLEIDVSGIAKSCGYKWCASVSRIDDIRPMIERMNEVGGPSFLEIKVDKGARAELGRPKNAPLENRLIFMRSLERR
jgi:phosphonopyruvate decarboxylase